MMLVWSELADLQLDLMLISQTDTHLAGMSVRLQESWTLQGSKYKGGNQFSEPTFSILEWLVSSGKLKHGFYLSYNFHMKVVSGALLLEYSTNVSFLHFCNIIIINVLSQWYRKRLGSIFVVQVWALYIGNVLKWTWTASSWMLPWELWWGLPVLQSKLLLTGSMQSLREFKILLLTCKA